MKIGLAILAVLGVLCASACGSSGSGPSQRSSGASSTASSIAAAVIHQIKMTVEQTIPSSVTVTGVSTSGGHVVISTKLPDTTRSRKFAKTACGAASAVAAGLESVEVDGASGQTLASC
jgi:hypothetical protein